jgi:hypothetical protein
MIATIRRIGGTVVIVLVLIAAAAVVYLTVPSDPESQMMSPCNIPGHALHCTVCQLPYLGRAGSASQSGIAAEGAETTSTGRQAEGIILRPMSAEETLIDPR